MKELAGSIEERRIEGGINAMADDVDKAGLVACPQQLGNTCLAAEPKRVVTESSDINNRK